MSANQKLTSTVGESPEACSTHRAVSTNNVWLAAALAPKRLAGVALGSDLVAGARQRSIVEEGRERHGRAEAERGGGGRTGIRENKLLGEGGNSCYNAVKM